MSFQTVTALRQVTTPGTDGLVMHVGRPMTAVVVVGADVP